MALFLKLLIQVIPGGGTERKIGDIDTTGNPFKVTRMYSQNREPEETVEA
jgi:hypothetical protein